MFGFLKKKRETSNGEFVIARLNARVQPIDRGEYYEDPLDDLIKRDNLGAVTGGGTQLADEPAGIEFCDLEIKTTKATEETLNSIVAHLEAIGVPKGSRLIVERDGRELPFGNQEGLGLFLNGSDLPEDVYADCDVNFVIKECNRLMEKAGAFRGHWEGSKETALYFYGEAFSTMKAAIGPFIESYPLCQKARLEQIA